jgi:hypothetical protein
MKHNKIPNRKLQVLLPAAALLIGSTMTSSSHAFEDYYQKILFEPSEAILEAENRGRVTIYDGLRYDTVMRAMDEQFNRIDNMMFVGTIIEQEDGELDVEEDGCD